MTSPIKTATSGFFDNYRQDAQRARAAYFRATMSSAVSHLCAVTSRANFGVGLAIGMAAFGAVMLTSVVLTGSKMVTASPVHFSIHEMTLAAKNLPILHVEDPL
jgi:hypothetical protein